MAGFVQFRRFEPRARDNTFEGTLATEVRDPLWFLARQWQIGEFEGTDAGSLAYIELEGSHSKLPRWLVQTGSTSTVTEIDPDAPLEPQTLSEPFEADLAMRVEMGHDFADYLRQEVGDNAVAENLLSEFRKLFAYQINELPDDQDLNPVDPATKRFLKVCAGRVVDGFSLYTLAKTIAGGGGAIPSAITTDPTEIVQIEAALATLLEQITRVFGEVSEGDLPGNDPETWKPERLEYRLQVVGAEPSGLGNATMNAVPDRDGEFDWYSFDVVSRDTGASEEAPVPVTFAIIPTRVHFDGMPATRFWNFEENKLPLPEIDADSDDLLKVLATDFMLLHSHDWYTFPFEQEVGTLMRTKHIIVHDVFGKLIVVKRADEGATTASPERFTMFSHTDNSNSSVDDLADYFMVPPSAGPAMRLGSILEDVRFGRDEMANLAWGIERITTSPIGEQRSGGERNAEIDERRVEPTPPALENDFPLEYNIESDVPAHWIPLLPNKPGPTPSIELQRSSALKNIGSGLETVPALSAILNRPSSPYLIKEEEIPRSGLTVQRVVYRTRWVDGSNHLWVQRRRKVGAGESQSGLQFDQARNKKG